MEGKTAKGLVALGGLGLIFWILWGVKDAFPGEYASIIAAAGFGFAWIIFHNMTSDDDPRPRRV